MPASVTRKSHKCSTSTQKRLLKPAKSELAMNEGVEVAAGGWASNYSSNEIVITTFWLLESGIESFRQTIECAGAASIDFNWKTFFLRSENFLPTFHPRVSPRPSFTKFTAAEGNSTEFSFSKQNFSRNKRRDSWLCNRGFLGRKRDCCEKCPNEGASPWNVK